MISCRAFSTLFLLCAAHSACSQEVKGSLTANGVTKPLTHVCAHEFEDPKSKDLNVVIVLSDRALTREQALTESRLEDLMRQKKLTALRVVLDANSRVRSAAPYSPAMTSFVSSGAYINWTPEIFDDSVVSGRVKSWDDAELAGERWSYDILFVTPITLAPGSDPPVKRTPASAMKLPVIRDDAPPMKPATSSAKVEAEPAKSEPPKGGPGKVLSLVRGTGSHLTQITISICGPFVRNDMGAEATTITDTVSGDMISLSHEARLATRTSGAELKKMMEQAKAEIPAAFAEPPPPVRTSRVENIGSEECHVYTLTTQGITSTFWVAAGSPYLDLLKDDFSALEKSGAAVLSLKGIPGIVIQSSTRLGDETNYTMLTDVKKTTFQASRFTVPAGYKTTP